MLVALIILARGGGEPQGFQRRAGGFFDFRSFELGGTWPFGNAAFAAASPAPWASAIVAATSIVPCAPPTSLHGVIVAIRPETLQRIVKLDLARIVAPKK